jgi:hypothetical protein
LRYRINSLIVTLAMMEVVRGLAYITSHGDAVMISEESFFELGGGSFLGISYPIWSNIVGFVLFGFLLKKTVFGKNVLAVGGNGEAALLAGLPVTRIKITVFVLQGLVTGFAGVMLASRMSLGSEDVRRTRTRRDFGLRARRRVADGRRRDDFRRARRCADHGLGAGRDEPHERTNVLSIPDPRRHPAARGAVRPVPPQQARGLKPDDENIWRSNDG